jgi:hypothetical protein
MKRLINAVLLAMAATLMSACSSMAEMKEVPQIKVARADAALINFVRPAVFMGDGIGYEVWDGLEHVGSLNPGTIVQYHATPGDHVIMIDQDGPYRWVNRKITVEAGKIYYVKTNMIPGYGLKLGSTDSSDKRTIDWHKEMTHVAVDTSKAKQITEETRAEAKAYLELVLSKK